MNKNKKTSLILKLKKIIPLCFVLPIGFSSALFAENHSSSVNSNSELNFSSDVSSGGLIKDPSYSSYLSGISVEYIPDVIKDFPFSLNESAGVNNVFLYSSIDGSIPADTKEPGPSSVELFPIETSSPISSRFFGLSPSSSRIHFSLKDNLSPKLKYKSSYHEQQLIKPAHILMQEKSAEVVSAALDLAGVPYRWGGESEESGFDCSGFVKAVYGKSVGIPLPRKASQQAAVAKPVKAADIKPGDLVFFNTMRKSFSHVGIYVGEGLFIHSPRKGLNVQTSSMKNKYWKAKFNGARRLLIH